MGLLVGRVKLLLVVSATLFHLHQTPTYVVGDALGDTLGTFASNYGNALAEFGAHGHTVVATGSLENLSKYHLRLVKCTNTQGAMIHPFPITVPPGAQLSGISGYGKKIKAPDQEMTKSWLKKAKNKLVKLSFFALNSMNLKQTCEYALYDGEKKKADLAGTNLIKLSIVLEQNMYTGDRTKDAVDAAEANDMKKESSLKIEFCTTEVKCEPFNYERTSYNGKGLSLGGFTIGSRLIGTIGFSAEQVHMKRCSEMKDLCVEASMGTGNKPRFRFSVVPFEYANMAEDAQKSIHVDKKTYCEMLTYTYQIGRIPTGQLDNGKPVQMNEIRRDEQEMREIERKNKKEPKPNRSVYTKCMGSGTTQAVQAAASPRIAPPQNPSGQTRAVVNATVGKPPPPENPKPHVWIPKIPRL